LSHHYTGTCTNYNESVDPQ